MFSTHRQREEGDVPRPAFFGAPLDATSAENIGNYHVTQKISKKKTANVRVVAATYSAGNNSVTLTLGNPKPGKAMQVTVSGLVGADGHARGDVYHGPLRLRFALDAGVARRSDGPYVARVGGDRNTREMEGR